MVGFLVCLFLDRSLYLLNYKKSSFLTSFLIFSFSGARKTDGQTITYVFFDLAPYPLCELKSGLEGSRWMRGRSRAGGYGFVIPAGNAHVTKKGVNPISWRIFESLHEGTGILKVCSQTLKEEA
jgi:hypothetical protein